MCEPLTIATLAVTAIGGVMQAQGQAQAGKAANDAAKYQAKVAENNAILARRSKEDALARGAEAEARQRAQGRLLLGKQRAAFASNGVDVGSDSVADIQASQAGLNELDALTVRANAQREAAGYEMEAYNYTAQGQMLRAQGAQQEAAGKGAAMGTLLSTGASVGSQWYQMGGTDMFKSKAGIDSVKWGTSSSVWNRGYP